MLRVSGLTKEYHGLTVLKDLDFQVEDQEIVAVLGPSGCGKSTLLNLIGGVVRGYQGRIENKAERIGYVFQEDRLLPWLTVYDNIRIVRRREDKERILQLISQMRLTGFEDYYPEQLSGGMCQRCGIARAFYYGSQLLLMDEPFKSLDFNLRLEMLKSLSDLWETEQTSVIFVTHDIDEALMIADRITVMRGRPAEVAGEFLLPPKKKLRDLSDSKLAQIKTEILNMMHSIMM